MRKLKMGVIGTGMAWNRLHLPAVNQLTERYEVVAMADENEEVLKASADRMALSHNNIYTDFKQMLKRGDIDVVDIAVPIHLNYKVSEAVAKEGIDIICEKPLAPDIEQGIEYLSLRDKYGVRILIAENYRYNEETNIIKSLYAENRVGDIQYVIKNCSVNFTEDMKKNKFSAKEWRQHPHFKGGVFLDNAVHDIAALRYIFGGIDKVTAFGKGDDDEFTPYTTISALLQFHSGIIANLSFCFDCAENQRPAVGFRAFGNKGQIYLEDKFCGLVNVFHNDGRHEMIHFTPERGYYNEFLNFHKSITEEETIETTPVIEFGDAKIVFDILDAIAENEVIDVTDSTKYILQMNELSSYTR